MGKTTELRREIRQRFVPYSETLGFKPDARQGPQFLQFRQVVGEDLHVFDIQWEKYGKQRFVVNFGKGSSNGIEFNGRKLQPNEMGVAHCPIRGRLKPGNGSLTSSWFRQDKHFLQRLFGGEPTFPPQQVVDQLIELFPELLEFFRSGKAGKHMHLFPSVKR